MNITLLATNSAGMAGSSRIGTAIAPISILLARLGKPSYAVEPIQVYPDRGDMDCKVTIGWIFETPRGRAELRDYWWNQKVEWSIAAASRKPALWLARHLRQHGICASTRAYKAADVVPFARSA